MSGSDKSSYRLKARQIRSGLTRSEKKKINETLNRQVLDWVNVHQPSDIALYWPSDTEVDIRPVITSLLTAKKRVYLPSKHSEDELGLAPFEALSELKETWGRVKGGSRACISKRVADEQVALWLVPGLAFDQNGTRLGQGKGIYDRLLADAKGHKIGLANVLLPDLPRDDWDVPMDTVFYI
ncbi:MAG: 5-formyltetrahydrofolate cyclo-ligase [Actinobacteria bacterium]|nr:5-formyltetrahydrofolate cyclo-ligase [Actinomycetota bacterium]